MKIFFSTLSFGERTNTYKIGKNTVTEVFDDKNALIKRIEYDEFNRDVDSKWFGSTGELSEHLHKEYYKKADEDDEVTKAAAKGESEIIIAKHRNGPVGTVKLLFQGNITKFKNPIKTDVF